MLLLQFLDVMPAAPEDSNLLPKGHTLAFPFIPSLTRKILFKNSDGAGAGLAIRVIRQYQKMRYQCYAKKDLLCNFFLFWRDLIFLNVQKKLEVNIFGQWKEKHVEECHNDHMLV